MFSDVLQLRVKKFLRTWFYNPSHNFYSGYIMKKQLISLSVVLCCMAAGTAYAATGCEAKKQDIQQEIAYAREHGNTARLSGLEKALREANEHCTESGLLTERQEKVAEKQRKVEEREQDLRGVEVDGRIKKIEKQKRKLAEAREELEEAKADLNR